MNQDRRKILFISRNYPPQVGGLEQYAYHLIRQFEKYNGCFKIVLKMGKKHLLWFIPFSFFKAIFWQKRFDINRIHLCDAVLSPVGLFLKRITGASVSVSIHGLDITYRNRLYQKLISRCVSQLDKVICVSQATRDECLFRQIPARKCVVIPNGVEPEDTRVQESRQTCREIISDRIEIALSGKKVLLSVGRIVERKGIGWFVREVMPKFDQSVVYIVAGSGPEFGRIKRIVQNDRLESSVILMGRVSRQTRNRLYHAADIFVMPNIDVKDDVEGFGIAAIEAGSCGLPVVASDIQGIKDAVIHKKTGLLVKAGHAHEFYQAISRSHFNRNEIRNKVLKMYSWENIFVKYHAFLTS